MVEKNAKTGIDSLALLLNNQRLHFIKANTNLIHLIIVYSSSLFIYILNQIIILRIFFLICFGQEHNLNIFPSSLSYFSFVKKANKCQN